MDPVSAILIGAGDRGMNSYAPYALMNPHQLRFVAVADQNETKLSLFSDLHQIPAKMRFRDWEELFTKPRMAEIAMICTQDKLHFEPALEALKQGYYVLLEKPMSTEPAECHILTEYAGRYSHRLLVCYVLRYTDFFTTIRVLLDEGRIGRLISMQHTENVPLIDQAHAFVRGNWRNSAASCPMILAHCCHDMDLLYWFAGSRCKKVSSFGSVAHFRSQDAPVDAPLRCLDGCRHEQDCPYSVSKIYLTENTDWPASVISEDNSMEARYAALQDGPYGRCVYHCDNDVVDNQVANFEFENGVTATFNMCPFNKDAGRTLKLMGTRGELRAAFGSNEIEIYNFSTGRSEFIVPKPSARRYGGGDYGIVEYLVKSVRMDKNKGLTSADSALESHLMSFAAEKSRIENRTIFFDAYRSDIERSAHKSDR